jgi:ribosome maturation factor RimP
LVIREPDSQFRDRLFFFGHSGNPMNQVQDVKAGVDLARVRAAIAPVLSARGVVLVDLDWLTDRGGWVLRVTIEREGLPSAPQSSAGLDAVGGVALEDCADVSRGISALIDADEDLVPHRHHLEVSSPGLDRPLRTETEFARFVGKTAKVKLHDPAPDGQRLLRGELEAAPAGVVAVKVDGKRVEVPFTSVAEANLVFELTPQPKKAPAAKKSPARNSKPASERGSS